MLGEVAYSHIGSQAKHTEASIIAGYISNLNVYLQFTSLTSIPCGRVVRFAYSVLYVIGFSQTLFGLLFLAAVATPRLP